MQPLPIDPYLPRITGLLRESGALVLVGPPGSGKTTRVPPAVLAEGLRSRGRVIVLQPRRIAARAAAARIAQERGWTLGAEVGYTVRFENRTSARTGIQVVTEGILTRRLQGDPFLQGVSAVILDEFHERSIHADVALALLREIRRAGREDLLVLVMSATLDPEPISRFLGGCPVVVTEGRPYPVEVRHIDPATLLDARDRRAPGLSPAPREMADAAAKALRQTWSETRGHALVFLPGIGEIRRAAEALEPFSRSTGARILPLHGALDLDEQQAALDPVDGRKVVLSTNIAETSLTIEGVDLVIDGGYARVLRNDPRHGIDRLEVERISKHSAEQRSGRAGRVGPGLAIRLWSRREHEGLREEEEPEVRRLDLAATILELKAWGVGDPSRFEWFEAPDPTKLDRAEELLLGLGAIEERHGPPSEIGKAMLGIPTHPRIARMLVAARKEGLLREAALLAALIEERDVLPLAVTADRGGGRAATRAGPSDLLLRADLFEEAERRGFRRDAPPATAIDLHAARAVARTRDALLRAMGERRASAPSGEPTARGSREREESLLRLLLLGYPDRVARRRSKGSDRALMVGRKGVALAPRSVVKDAELFLAIDLEEGARGERSDARVHVASALRRSWLEEDLAPFLTEAVETAFDPGTQKVRSTATLCYRDLPLEDPRDRRPPPEVAGRLLAQALRPRAEELFASHEDSGAWLRRVRCLAAWMPELELPAFDAARLGDIIAEACAGKVSAAEVGGSDLLALLRASVPHGMAAAVDRHAPEALRVPSGSRIRLEYEPGRPPVLAVRLQELFGLAETPTVAAGRVPVLLHLLGPNFRPVQITQDLRSFWSNTYAQVRKDLRARYPKHAWPEDPWVARPEKKG